MRHSTPSMNSSTKARSCSLGTGVSGPAGMWWTRRPGSTATTAGRVSDQARVYTSMAAPALASAEDSSRT